jgi:hypothetical protein
VAVLLSRADGVTPLQAVRVTDSFVETFVVAPYPKEYRVELVCSGAVKGARIVRYGSEVGPGERVQLEYDAL